MVTNTTKKFSIFPDIIGSVSFQTSSPSFLRAAIWSGSPSQFIKLRSRNGGMFFNIEVTHVLSQDYIQKIQDSPPVSGDIWLVQELNPGLAPLSFIPPTDEECAKLVSLSPGKSILHRSFICEWIENLLLELTSCCCFLHSISTQAYSQNSVPKNAASIDNRCFWMLPFATLSDLETAARRQNYLADMLVRSKWLFWSD